GLGYTLGRRSGSRAVRQTRAPAEPARRAEPVRRIDARSTMSSPRRAQPESAINELAPDADRISSAPDALDVALNLDGLFDVESSSGVQLTARTTDHLSGPRSNDDDDAPAPEDLGRIWLEQATETEHRLGLADTIPDVENLPRPTRDIVEGEALDGETVGDEDDDETTAEYVRRHRISSAG
ncbi:MAG TPA: hypothetical protein VHM25_14940, partial [Polyangiaceae bacterium]|nr:hypothetical protein [Polyangiaceae bacterium]